MEISYGANSVCWALRRIKMMRKKKKVRKPSRVFSLLE